MEGVPGTNFENAGSSPREPLQPRVSTGLFKQVRRKSSFLLRSDSSDDYPSPHDSIFEAVYISATNSDELSNRIELVAIPPRKSKTQIRRSGENDENSREQSSTLILTQIDDVEFLYGHGTLLDTITEQKSNATMRTLARSKSADDMPNSQFLSHRDSFMLAKKVRRQESLSLGNMVLMDEFYHAVCSMIAREGRKYLSINEIYAEPKAPAYAPPERPPTPPGMPSWTEAQSRRQSRNSTCNQSGTQTRIRRFFGLRALGMTHSPHIPGSRTSSSPIAGRAAFRFKPPRSIYGTLNQHPFASAPISKARGVLSQSRPSNTSDIPQIPRPANKRKASRHVQFTPSAMSRDHETNVSNGVSPSSGHGNIETTQVLSTRCPHRRMQRTTAQGVPIPREESVIAMQPALAQTISFTNPQSVLSTRNNSPDLGSSRSVSVSSTAHLVSGRSKQSSVLSRPDSVRLSLGPVVQTTSTPRSNAPCWKCRVEKVFEGMDRLWMQATGCLCMVCCGFHVHDDGSVTPGVAILPSRARRSDSMDHHSEPRNYRSNSPGYGFATRSRLPDSILHYPEPRSCQDARSEQNSHHSQQISLGPRGISYQQTILQQIPVVCL